MNHHALGIAFGSAQPITFISQNTLNRPPEARGQGGYQLEQFGAWHAGAHQHGLACGIDAVDGKNILGQIDAYGYDSHGLPLPEKRVG
jgi:hypothetical protein